MGADGGPAAWAHGARRRDGARHLIENYSCKLKQFRAIATRNDKTAHNFLAAVYLAATHIVLN